MVWKNAAALEVMQFFRDQRGNSFFQHALLLSLIAVVCLIALLAYARMLR